MKSQSELALDDIQDAFMLFMRGVEAIDSGRVKHGRDTVWSAMGLLLEAEHKLTSKRTKAQHARCVK